MVKEEINQSTGYEVQVPCIKCSGRTAHEIIVSVDQSGTEPKYCKRALNPIAIF